MTEKDQHLINELKHNIRRLINEREQTKAELDLVRNNFNELQASFNLQKQEHDALNMRYENLKVAKALADGDPDNQAARLKINKIIREVDKCIALLNQ